MVHSNLGASSAYRWMVCPGSVSMCVGKKGTQSVYATEGSAAHALAERCLHSKKPAKTYLGRVIARVEDNWQITPDNHAAQEGEFEVTEEMAGAVQVYLDVIEKDLIGSPGAELAVEKGFELTTLHPRMFGTNDACIVEAFGSLRVYDYKHGQGHAVEVEENPQLMYYAYGAMQVHGEDFDTVELIIVQPRARHKDGQVRRWTTTAEHIKEWAKGTLLDAARATEQPGAKLVAGDHCEFCNALATCPAVLTLALETTKADFASEALPDPRSLSLSDRVRVLQSADILRKWLKEVETSCFFDAEKGVEVPGYKLVRKKGNRVWTDEKEVINKMFAYRTHIFTKKLLSPAAMLTLVKNKGWDVKIEELIEKPDNGLTLVPISDRREAVQPFSEFDEMFS